MVAVVEMIKGWGSRRPEAAADSCAAFLMAAAYRIAVMWAWAWSWSREAGRRDKGRRDGLQGLAGK